MAEEISDKEMEIIRFLIGDTETRFEVDRVMPGDVVRVAARPVGGDLYRVICSVDRDGRGKE